MAEDWFTLPISDNWESLDRSALFSHVRYLTDAGTKERMPENAMSARLRAAILILDDLAEQGWSVRVRDGSLEVRAAAIASDAVAEKARVRIQELKKRDEQLQRPSVRRFVRRMESPREHNGEFVSVFSLMRDGQQLADQIRSLIEQEEFDSRMLREVIDPYVQVISPKDRCEFTGLRLMDIWRYFRHTWTNQYRSTPGRSLLILIRDQAARFHPVIGIAALGSAVIQIAARDSWIGWQSDQVLADFEAAPSKEAAQWVWHSSETRLGELYLDDLIEDGIYWPQRDHVTDPELIARLEVEATKRREDHRRFAQRSDFHEIPPENRTAWEVRARSDLYRSKRCVELAGVLRVQSALAPFLYPTPTQEGLERAIADPLARKAIKWTIKRAKAKSVGTEIADLTVCGAIAPYNELLGGKLVSLLSVGPTVVNAYGHRYEDHVSVIASSLAGRPIRRRSALAFIGTTSLYGSGSSQYNRIRLPAHVLNSTQDLRFLRLGRSKSFGTAHLSERSVQALEQFAEHHRHGTRVKSIFGEGVSPKMRKVREGLDRLGWPANGILKHGRQRILYGVPLIENLRRYLLGMDTQPEYAYDLSMEDDVERISDWWFERWVANRVRSDEVIARISSHRTDRPVKHGARVELPPSNLEAHLPGL